MLLEKGFDPHLVIGATTITSRDIEMLRAIHQRGSMNEAAESLGRSYPHLQRRIVELEDIVGSLTKRVRGGEGGGGTQLTVEALDLIRQFDRLRTELNGVTTVSESTIEGTVISRDGGLVTVDTPAGEVLARASDHGENVEITVRADAVVLMKPGSPSQVHTSLRNQLRGEVVQIEHVDGVATVMVQLAPGLIIDSVVTVGSVNRLELAEESSIVAAFKTTAARAIPIDI